jgi:ABC-type nitrate/sulfonate/bicarbonate transport system permease component
MSGTARQDGMKIASDAIAGEGAPAAPPGRARSLLGRGRNGYIGAASILTFIVVWQLASLVAPSYAVPGWSRIIVALGHLSYRDVLVTVARVIVSMAGSFVFGLGLSVAIFERPVGEAFVMPLVRLLMAVPAVCWVVFSILWFAGVEFRIFFVMCVVCAPVFVVDTLDAMKSVPADLCQMVDSFRPTTAQRFLKIILPGIVPNLITSWKVNMTLAIRVVTIAELVGALSGIGHGLVLAEEVFSVADVFAWTVVLVVILLAFETIIALAEHRALRWRQA